MIICPICKIKFKPVRKERVFCSKKCKSLNDIKDLKGKKFGRLSVLEIVGKEKNGHYVWGCLCDCGQYRKISVSSLTKKNGTRSCGCLHSKHGFAGTPFYQRWKSMIKRCYNKNDSAYKNYGKRGIGVCTQWFKFENFKNKMFSSFVLFEKQNGKNSATLERLDNNKNYCPNNCTWATKSQQSKHTSRIVYLKFKNKTLSVTDWAEKLGIKRGTIHSRIGYGFPIKKILSKKLLS